MNVTLWTPLIKITVYGVSPRLHRHSGLSAAPSPVSTCCCSVTATDLEAVPRYSNPLDIRTIYLTDPDAVLAN